MRLHLGNGERIRKNKKSNMRKNMFFSTVLLLVFIVSVSFYAMVSEVYICTGKYSKKYHYVSDCRGLSNCKSSIKEVDINDAKNYGRTLCGWED